ncbi:MAG: hypothetical protein ACK40G_13920 [Cytophagaceae bacterium]
MSKDFKYTSGIETRRKMYKVTVRVTKRGEFKTFNFPIPPNVNKVIGVFITSSISGESLGTTKAYFGKGAAGFNSNANIQSLSEKKEIQNVYGVYTVNAGVGEKIYYAHPKRLGIPAITITKANMIKVNGGFMNPKVVSVTDAGTGFIEDYLLFETFDENLGSCTITIAE